MTEFTAINGIHVDVLGVSGILRLLDETSHLLTVDPVEAQALREFFQHERDEELGRWRWPANPDYVVYPKGNGNTVVSTSEGSGRSIELHRGQTDMPRGASELIGAAHAYFEAHPETKPWEDAKNGEIWEFTLGCSWGQYLADDRRFFRLPLRAPSDPKWKPASFASDFEHGKRIWPEDAS